MMIKTCCFVFDHTSILVLKNRSLLLKIEFQDWKSSSSWKGRNLAWVHIIEDIHTIQRQSLKKQTNLSKDILIKFPVKHGECSAPAYPRDTFKEDISSKNWIGGKPLRHDLRDDYVKSIWISDPSLKIYVKGWKVGSKICCSSKIFLCKKCGIGIWLFFADLLPK